jgi:two-component system, cell cycle response regulator
MCKEKSRYLELEKINKRIEELRETLNEMCCTAAEDGKDKERLMVSMDLDELIVEYMREINKVNKA